MEINSIKGQDLLQIDSAKKKDEKDIKSTFLEIWESMREEKHEEPVFKIGAGEYTIKEWDAFLAKFDKAEAKIQEEVEEEAQDKLEKKYALEESEKQ